MKKIDVDSHFTQIDVQDPEPQDNEVLIKVRATVVNSSDILGRDYMRYPEGSRSYICLECSGTIEKVGRKVKNWRGGDEVCAIVGGGGYAEKVVVHEEEVLPKPSAVSFTCAACLPHASCVVWSELFLETPLNCFYHLRDEKLKMRLCRGKSLLVHEDCNGTSSFAIQIGKLMNVKDIYATFRSDSFRQHCNRIGVTQLMPQSDFLNGALTLGVDVILNNLGPDHFLRNFSQLNDEGIIISTSTCCSDIIDGSNFLPSRPDKSLPKNVIIQATSLLHREMKERSKIVAEVSKNVWPKVHLIEPFVHHEVFPFSKVGDAYKLMDAGECGKIIIVPDDIFNAPIRADGIGAFSSGGTALFKKLL